MLTELTRMGLPKSRRSVRHIGLKTDPTAPPGELGGLHSKVHWFDACRPTSPAGFPSVGARGCFLSHLGCLTHALEQGHGRVLVLEDDLMVNGELLHDQAGVVEQLESTPWDMVYLGHALSVPRVAPTMLVPFDDPVMLAHFYGVSEPCIQRLVTFLQKVLARPPGHPDGGPMHVDGAFSTFRSQNSSVRTLVAHPSLGGTRSTRSDIHAGKLDKIAALRAPMGVLRAAKRIIQRFRT
ncbi:MAG: LPS biosynthesis glycosyltransferase [Proteobacteria bacterium]|nr:LPS biosynthesis glycosyltransferase [Pseudomonadota bacterium]